MYILRSVSFISAFSNASLRLFCRLLGCYRRLPDRVADGRLLAVENQTKGKGSLTSTFQHERYVSRSEHQCSF